MDFLKSTKGGPFGLAGGRIPEGGGEGVRPPALPKSAPDLDLLCKRAFILQLILKIGFERSKEQWKKLPNKFVESAFMLLMQNKVFSKFFLLKTKVRLEIHRC